MKDTTKITLVSATTGAVVMTQVETRNEMPLAADLAFGGMVGALAPAGLMGVALLLTVFAGAGYQLLKFVCKGPTHD